MREIVFDTETTGREPAAGDRIVEIGCVEIVNMLPTGRTFHAYVNPERDVPAEVVAVHGLTTRFLSDKPTFGDPTVVDALIDFFADDPIVAHNAAFDRKFLNAELSLLGRPAVPDARFVDTLAIAREKFRGASNSLDALSKRFMLDRDGFDLDARKGAGGHGALIDAKILARVYLELRGGREQKLAIFQDSEAQNGGGGQGLHFVRRAPRPKPLAPRITPEEAAAHEAFLDTLKDPLWRRGE
ncbi:MAG: DNA polymerase III subunit epsilon [Alphaproteobacteria bacterium]|nr:DNA polymerase III subunit epsilon [Alphaproteobacteria bacterium]